MSVWGNPVTLGGSGGSANIQALSVTQNGTYTASGGVDGYSPVTVNVSGGAADCWWRVRYYDRAGTTLWRTAYVLNGDDAPLSSGKWTSQPGGGPEITNILNDVHENLDVYPAAGYSLPAVLLTFDTDAVSDTGVAGVTWAVQGSAAISTAVKKFGNSSLQFSGGYLQTTAANDAFNFGSGDFTIDFWLYVASPGNRMTLFAMNADCRIGMDLWRSTPNMWFSSNGSSWNVAQADNTSAANSGAGSIAVAANTWTHIAYVKSGNHLLSFVNGQVNKDLTISGGVSLYYDSKLFRIGLWGQGSYPLTGYIDEFRVLKGTAAWTEAFTPPTEPY